MGFVTAFTTDWRGQGQSPSGTTVTVPAMRAGDMLVVMMTTVVAADVLTITGLTNAATVIESNTDMASIFVGGAGVLWIGYISIVQADVTAHTFTINSSKGSQIGYCFLLVRSSAVSAPSLTVTANTAAFFTVASTSVTCPQNTPSHTHDMRILFIASINNPNATLYTLAEANTANNVGGAQTYTVWVGTGGNSSGDCNIIMNPGIISSLDTGTATLTESGATAGPKWYIRPVIISEGGSDSAPPASEGGEDLICPIDIRAAGLDHDIGSPGADIIGRGGGSGISVY